MCSDQPTYCYPNGCFKTSVIKKKTESPVSRIDNKAHGMFLVDQNKELLEMLESHMLKDERSVTTERPLNEFTLRPNPFTELVFKQKRLPKLKMRYNLREQVKNTKPRKLKRDSVKLSKTRWPLNKQILHIKHPLNQIIHKRDDDKEQINFEPTVRQETTNYTPKYFKKYLAKRENGDVNVEALYLYKTDSANFSLEALIDNMIEGSLLENTNNVKLNLNINMNNSDELSETRKLPRNFTDFSNKKIDLEVISLNSSGLEGVKYIEQLEDGENKNITKMIETMSNKIDKQNNISVEIFQKITGSKLDSNGMPNKNNKDVYPNTTSELKRIDRAILDSISERNVPLVRNTKKKSKQRVVRTLRKGKAH
ncbi:uncharacterized protein LOC110993488 [Pieris rapae]|uniref:uncharacterized protein LOC110993488 n=1 Tax=Pieris rapae TaxID=64459 RepID=UPI001E27AA87|nr:uncharacterized protein LOC110993488 [Pieris rapae]